MIQVGQKAPDFSLVDQNGNTVTLSALKGKKVLLSWHPLAWTSVCLDQMRALEREIETLKAKNTVALGLSVDHQPSKAAWAKFACIEETPLLADYAPLGAVAEAYGIYVAAGGHSQRANIIVDENGDVAWAKCYELGELPDLNEVLAQL